MAEESDRSIIVDFLVREYNFSSGHAEDAYQRLSVDEHILKDFKTYCQTGQFPVKSVRLDAKTFVEYRVEGYTAGELADDYGFSPVGAYLMLADLVVDPDGAKERLAEISRKGLEIVERDESGRIISMKFVSTKRKKLLKES